MPGEEDGAPPLGSLINDLRVALRAAYDEVLGPLQLTVPQVGVMAAIARAPGACIAQLAQEKAVTPQSMAEQVAGLESAGLIRRRHGEGRGHVLELHLTRDGAQVLGRAWQAMRAIEAQLWNDIGADDHARFRELLRRHLAPLRHTAD